MGTLARASRVLADLTTILPSLASLPTDRSLDLLAYLSSGVVQHWVRFGRRGRILRTFPARPVTLRFPTQLRRQRGWSVCAQPDFRSRSGPCLRFARNDGRGRYCPLAFWSNALSTASVIAVTPVWMVGFGTGANSGEWLSGSGGPPLRAAATCSGS